MLEQSMQESLDAYATQPQLSERFDQYVARAR